MTSYFYVALTIALTVYGQIVIKWQVLQAGEMPLDASGKIRFLLTVMINPWVISGLVAALLASMSWIAAMTKLQLSHAYPFMSATFILVIVLSGVLFHEPITTPKIIGLALIAMGIAVGSQG